VKKTISIIVLAASLLASLTVFVCYNPEKEEVDIGGKKYKGYSNPLDKDGDNYLYGNKDENCTPEHLFDPQDTHCNPPCDPVIPTITLVGDQSVTIGTHQLAEFRKWMHFDGGSWDNLITFDKGQSGSINPTTRDPCLKEGGSGVCKSSFTEAEKNTVKKGDYIIQYRVIKVAANGDTTCGAVTPQAIKERVLICTTYVAPDTATPVITLLGDKEAEFRVGTTYTDRGVTVSVGELDSIVVKGINNNFSQKLTKPITASAPPINITGAVAGNTYTITYHASYKGKSAVPMVRNVKVIAEVTSNVPAVIVLAGYKHKLKNGTVIDGYPDTMLFVGSTNENYKEKGVEKVYYMKDGAEVALDKNLVTTKNPSPFITGQSSSGTRTVNYDIAAAPGYAAANVKRNVFLVDNDCEEGKIVPEVKESGSSEIPAGVVWDYNSSWSVTNRDELGNGTAGYKYFIHFNGLDPNNPKVKAGGYKITYVGLGKCGGITELERTITVK